MNGFLAFLVLVGVFFAGLESSAPGVTAATVNAIEQVASHHALPSQLAAAIAAKGG
jgi:hypothetical protein